MTATTPDIFLSYNRDDQAIAQQFTEAFEAQGFSVWWDVTLRSGEAYDAVTEEALRSAKAVVVLWSKQSVGSRWVRAEATVADRNRTLVPVRIEPCDLPVMFELTQTADLSQWRGDSSDTVWRAFLEDLRGKVGSDSSTQADSPATAARDQRDAGGGMPTLAILPISCRAKDDELAALAEELADEITRELGQGRYWKVVPASTMAAWRSTPIEHRALARQLAVQYFFEGKLQRTGEQLRLSLQLIDPASDHTIWSGRVVRDLADIEASPEAFSAAVAAVLSQAVINIETGQALAKSDQLSGWQHILRAMALVGHPDPDSVLRADQEARQAVALVPDFGLAYAVLATVLASRMARYTVAWGAEGDDEQDTDILEIHDSIKRAMILDGGNPAVLTHVAFAFACLGEGEAGLRLAQRAVNMAPNSGDALASLGTNYFILGQPADAIAALSKVRDLALLDLSRPFALATLAICLFGEGQASEAEAAIDQSLALFPENRIALAWKAVIAAELGKAAAAKAALRLLQAIAPVESSGGYLRYIELAPGWYARKAEATDILRGLLREGGGEK